MTSQAYTLSQIVSPARRRMERRRHRHYRRPSVGSGAGGTHQLFGQPEIQSRGTRQPGRRSDCVTESRRRICGPQPDCGCRPLSLFCQSGTIVLADCQSTGRCTSDCRCRASAKVPASCEIGANAYIGANAVLGEGCRILANAVVQHDCTLGDEVVLHPNAVIYYGCTLGNRVEIHSGAVIGADGFGLAFAGDSWLNSATGAVTPGR